MSEYFVTIWYADDGVPTSYIQAEQITDQEIDEILAKKPRKPTEFV